MVSPREISERSISYIVDFVIEPEVCALERNGLLSGQELLGVITSHGPSRESYRSSRKSRGSAEAIAPSAADAAVSAEGVRGALSPTAGTPALLRRGMPGGGTEMVAPESPREIPGDGGGPTETEWSKRALPGARQKPENTRARCS